MDGSTNQDSSAGLADRYSRLLARISAAAARGGRSRDAVRLVAVAKETSDETVAAAIGLGIQSLAENRVQRLAARPPALRAAAAWHLIGPLQSNKVKQAVALAAEFQALDRTDLLPLLARAAAGSSRRLPVWLQVNVAGELQKHGCRPDGAESLARAIAAVPELELRGLMTIAPWVADPEEARPIFRRLRALSVQLLEGGVLDAAAVGLSMGMSGDFEVAIEEGATVVRVGSALFQGDAPC